MTRECRNAQEFSRIMWDKIRPYGWSWKKDVRPWLASALDGAKFADDRYDWSPEAAKGLAEQFLTEASTW